MAENLTLFVSETSSSSPWSIKFVKVFPGRSAINKPQCGVDAKIDDTTCRSKPNPASRGTRRSQSSRPLGETVAPLTDTCASLF